MKDEIVRYLSDNGFYIEENIYKKKVRKVVGETIINGEHHQEIREVELCFIYIGEGWEGNSETDNNPLTQWKFIVDDNDQGDFLVHDLEEFKNIFK